MECEVNGSQVTLLRQKLKGDASGLLSRPVVDIEAITHSMAGSEWYNISPS